ncbi:MAG: hypothetical protein E5V40_03510 [Mesorhizobium sp.]|nr:MAG: hypothetical protein E5V40_03510 [Mesorhizobium sp.]
MSLAEQVPLYIAALACLMLASAVWRYRQRDMSVPSLACSWRFWRSWCCYCLTSRLVGRLCRRSSRSMSSIRVVSQVEFGTPWRASPYWAMALSDDIRMAEKHVRMGERHVAEQRRRILELQLGHQSTEKAQELLQLFERRLDFHRRHLERLTYEMEDMSIDRDDDRSLRVVSTSKSRLAASKALLRPKKTA